MKWIYSYDFTILISIEVIYPLFEGVLDKRTRNCFLHHACLDTFSFGLEVVSISLATAVFKSHASALGRIVRKPGGVETLTELAFASICIPAVRGYLTSLALHGPLSIGRPHRGSYMALAGQLVA